jgi:transcriptional regulator with XRE-family HTH domain
MSEFVLQLRELVTQFGGTKQDLAREVGITSSAFSRLLKGSGRGGKPTLELCLRLAHATGSSAPRILRAAGLSELSDIIEDLYGPPAKFSKRPRQVSPIELKHLQQWRALSAADRKALLHTMARFAALHTRQHARSA